MRDVLVVKQGGCRDVIISMDKISQLESWQRTLQSLQGIIVWIAKRC